MARFERTYAQLDGNLVRIRTDPLPENAKLYNFEDGWLRLSLHTDDAMHLYSSLGDVLGKPNATLTEDENAALKKSGELWNSLLKLRESKAGLGKDDTDDLRKAIHDIQRIVLSRPALRALALPIAHVKEG